jgi:hypothetical protein
MSQVFPSHAKDLKLFDPHVNLLRRRESRHVIPNDKFGEGCVQSQ